MSRVSVTDLVKLQKQAVNLKNAASKAREKAGETVQRVVTAGESVASALAFGYLSGRAGEGGLKIMGVPTDVGFGLGCNLLSLTGVGRGMEDHLAAIGNGALCCYATKVGFKAGLDVTKEKGPLEFLKGDDEGGISGGLGMSNDQLAELNKALRAFTALNSEDEE